MFGKINISLLTSLILLFHGSWRGLSQTGADPRPGVLAGQPLKGSGFSEPGMLFYLSGENGLTADRAAGGQSIPNFLKDVTVIPDGALGKGLRADLAIGPEDVDFKDNSVIVKIHNMGSVKSPPTSIVLKDAAGKIVAAAQVPAIEAPVDLLPRWKKIALPVPAGTDINGSSLQIDPEGKIEEITRINSGIKLGNKK